MQRMLPVLVIALVGLTASCTKNTSNHSSSTSSTQEAAATVATSISTLVLADSPTPAASICGSAGGLLATVVLGPDVPDPRCQLVTADERLSVMNSTADNALITFAGIEVTLAPGEKQTIGPRFGDYLAPGVHVVHVSVYFGSGPELWLQ